MLWKTRQTFIFRTMTCQDILFFFSFCYYLSTNSNDDAFFVLSFFLFYCFIQTKMNHLINIIIRNIKICNILHCSTRFLSITTDMFGHCLTFKHRTSFFCSSPLIFFIHKCIFTIDSSSNWGEYKFGFLKKIYRTFSFHIRIVTNVVSGRLCNYDDWVIAGASIFLRLFMHRL